MQFALTIDWRKETFYLSHPYPCNHHAYLYSQYKQWGKV